MTVKVFTSRSVCFCTTWGMQTKQNTCWNKWQINVNKFFMSRSVVHKNQLITRFDCYALVCLPDDIQQCLWIQEVTDEVWIALKQNIIDTAVSAWRNRLHVCVWQYANSLSRFTVSSSKIKHLDVMPVTVSKIRTKFVLCVLLRLSYNTALIKNVTCL